MKKIDEEMMHAQVSFIVSLSFILLLLWALLGGILVFTFVILVVMIMSELEVEFLVEVTCDAVSMSFISSRISYISIRLLDFTNTFYLIS